MPEELKASPQKAPEYAIHREVSAIDTLPETNQKHGMNMIGYDYANIQVIPDSTDPPEIQEIPEGGGSVVVQVLWWCEEVAQFISEQEPIVKPGIGVDVPYEFTVPCYGRVMFVAVTTLTAGTCKIYVSGFNKRHPD